MCYSIGMCYSMNVNIKNR